MESPLVLNYANQKNIVLNDYLHLRRGPQPSIFSILQFLSEPDNIGNIVFFDAINYFVPGALNISTLDFIHQQKEISPGTTIILGLANFLSSTWVAPDGLIDALSKRRVILFSVGIQCELGKTEELVLSRDAEAMLQIVANSRTIVGARGEHTARFLSARSIPSITIGCPSVHRVPEAPAVPHLSHKTRVCTSNTMAGLHRDIAMDVNEFSIRHGCGYVIQTEAALAAETLGLSKDVVNFIASLSGNPQHAALLREENFDYGYYNKDSSKWALYREWFVKNAKLNVRIETWREFAAKFEILVGTRFHGGIVSMQAGVMPLFLPIDSRVEEMVLFHNLPRIDHAAFRQINDIGELQHFCSTEAFTDTRTAQHRAFNDFLLSNFLR